MFDSPIFIVGCPRSGTSLLRALLRSHPNLAFPPRESHFIPKLFGAYGDPRTERQACKLAAIILNLHWIRSWDLSLQPSSFAHCRSYGQIVSGIFQAWARKENKPRWGDKTPEYVTEIPTLLEVFPSCKIIHIFRDGRDVALSWLRAPFGPENVFTAATTWKHLVSTGHRHGATLPAETYLRIRYETLLTHPKETMKRICAFLGEPFTDEVLKPEFLERNMYPVIFGKPVPLMVSKTEIVRSNLAKWKEAMSSSDRILFESVAGDLLTSLGYQTEGLTRRISSSEQFVWKVHHFFWADLKQLNTKSMKSWMPTHLLMRWANIRYCLKSAGLIGGNFLKNKKAKR